MNCTWTDSKATGLDWHSYFTPHPLLYRHALPICLSNAPRNSMPGSGCCPARSFIGFRANSLRPPLPHPLRNRSGMPPFRPPPCPPTPNPLFCRLLGDGIGFQCVALFQRSPATSQPVVCRFSKRAPCAHPPTTPTPPHEITMAVQSCCFAISPCTVHVTSLYITLLFLLSGL